LRFAAADGEGSADIVGVEMPASRGIAGWAVMSGQPISVRDVAADARFARDVAEATNYVPTTILAAPMFDDDGETIGVLSVLDPRVSQSSDWTLAVLGTLASQVALLVSAGPRAAVSPLEELGRRVLELAEGHRGGQREDKRR
jgi:GAF domain-containing protein